MTGNNDVASIADSSTHAETETAEGVSHDVDQDVTVKEAAAPTLQLEGETLSDEPRSESQPSREATPPPLPPRPQNDRLLSIRPKASTGSLRLQKGGTRPQLQSKATTALSLTDIHSQLYGDGSGGTVSRQTSSSHGLKNQSGSEPDDSGSVKSYAPSFVREGDVESLLGEVPNDSGGPAWQNVRHQSVDSTGTNISLFPDDAEFDEAFEHEFDDLEDVKTDGSNEEIVMNQWKAKLKHFLILTSAGKPVWSRHGDDQLVTNYIGIVQTIISFYQDAKDSLKGFTAGGVRFVVVSKGYLNLVAISRLDESDAQLRTQLDSLYMQILSTLTLPNMERMFKARASTDLRRPLQGTEKLLSALADGFTRGSPSTLLSALECLRLRKSHRQVINNTLLKTRSPNLLYGLIVAGGRLVSVVRPKKHSLHPGDLHLIFNMLFEAGSVKAGGGENWIPLCLPGFNNTGYLYMYVSFLNIAKPSEEITERSATSSDNEHEVAILFISANKESFYELRQMRDDLAEQLGKNGSLDIIRSAIGRGRPSCTDIMPGTVIRHFLYKSRGNVQFVMPSFDPYFDTLLARRRLMTLYAHLQSTLHTRSGGRPKILHSTSAHHITLAWTTPLFDLYAIAPSTASRAALAQAANKLIQWVRREEERVFIIGGAVF